MFRKMALLFGFSMILTAGGCCGLPNLCNHFNPCRYVCPPRGVTDIRWRDAGFYPSQKAEEPKEPDPAVAPVKP